MLLGRSITPLAGRIGASHPLRTRRTRSQVGAGSGKSVCSLSEMIPWRLGWAGGAGVFRDGPMEARLG